MNSDNQQISQTPLLHHFLSLVVLLATLGCGGQTDGPMRASVTGKVTLDGQPLQAGTIQFIPMEETSGPKNSFAITDGQFDVPQDAGPVVGKHRIEIHTPASGEFAPDDEEALERLQQQGKRTRIDVIRIPAAYNRNSQLTADVTESGPNELSFELLSRIRN